MRGPTSPDSDGAPSMSGLVGTLDGGSFDGAPVQTPPEVMHHRPGDHFGPTAALKDSLNGL